jgi:Flp pilus assembly protein TadD
MLSDLLNLLTAPLRSRRGQVVAGLLVITGLISLLLSVFAPAADWLFPAQVLLVALFATGAAFALTPPEGRLRIVAGAAPAIGAILLGLTLLPDYFALLTGAGVGWFVAALFLFRQQTSPEVMRAIRQMRKGHYKQAESEIDEVIRRDKTNPEHYRLRAMIFRLDGRLDRARRDYDQMLEYAPPGDPGDAVRAEAYDGLAEVHLQAGRYEAANHAAHQAHQLFPENWVPLYNLGLINDRLRNPQATIDYLTRALELKIPDRRQRLLAHLYLARAYNRLDDPAAARSQVQHMADMWAALEELQKLIDDELASPLSAVLADDVQTARALMIDELEATDL